MGIKEAKNVVVSEALRSFSFKLDTMCKSPEEFTPEFCNLAAAVNIGVQIWWIQKNRT